MVLFGFLLYMSMIHQLGFSGEDLRWGQFSNISAMNLDIQKVLALKDNYYS